VNDDPVTRDPVPALDDDDDDDDAAINVVKVYWSRQIDEV